MDTDTLTVGQKAGSMPQVEIAGAQHVPRRGDRRGEVHRPARGRQRSRRRILCFAVRQEEDRQETGIF